MTTNRKSLSIMQKSFRASMVLILILLILLLIFQREAFRLYKVVTLFYPANIVQNFTHMSDFFPYRNIKKGSPNLILIANPETIIEHFQYQGEEFSVMQLLESTATTGFIVIKDERILHEHYALGNSAENLNISWSVNKSFVSALIGIAIEENYINSVDDLVTYYSPELIGSGYDQVKLKDVLQMSSGVGFDEDYAAFFSDINRMGRVVALGNSINEFAASLRAERPPGKFHQYVSMDTQVLGMVLKAATKRDPSEYLESKIWSKLGMSSDAKWLIDDKGMELAFGTLNVTLRDYARFGMLYANNGRWLGEQIVPAQWVADSISVTEEHLKPGDNPLSSSRLGYGYQWWIPEQEDGDFLARGVYGQYIYINPKQRVVIVKTSADPYWRAGNKQNSVVINMFQQIANSL